MIINPPDKIAENIWAIGTREFPSFLIKTPNATILLEPELSCCIGPVERHLKEMGMSLENIDCCIILHEHYDHCMMTPALKETHPNIKVYIPAGFKEMLSEKLISSYTLSDQYSCQKISLSSRQSKDFEESIEYSESTQIEEIEFIHTPGHSPLSYTAMYKGVFFVSDALGFFGEKNQCPLYFYNFDLYVKSIEKIASLKPKIIVTGHFSTFHDKQAEDLPTVALRLAEEMRTKLKDKDPENSEHIEELFAEIYQGDFLLYPPEVIKSVVRYLIKRSR